MSIILQGYGAKTLITQGYGGVGIVPPPPPPPRPARSSTSGAGGQSPLRKKKLVTPAMMLRRFQRYNAGHRVPHEVKHDWKYYLNEIDKFFLIYDFPLEVAKEFALEQTCQMRNYMNEYVEEETN